MRRSLHPRAARKQRLALDQAGAGRVQCKQVFSILITEKGGAQRQLDFEAAEIGIGRLEDNDLCLPKNNVSKHHARLVFKDDRYVIVDQKSTNGTYVNGRRITGPMVVRRGDKIYIGDFILTLAGLEGIAAREFAPLPMGAAGPAGVLDPTTPKRPLARGPRSQAVWIHRVR